jgi:hypothetical protein
MPHDTARPACLSRKRGRQAQAHKLAARGRVEGSALDNDPVLNAAMQHGAAPAASGVRVREAAAAQAQPAAAGAPPAPAAGVSRQSTGGSEATTGASSSSESAPGAPAPEEAGPLGAARLAAAQVHGQALRTWQGAGSSAAAAVRSGGSEATSSGSYETDSGEGEAGQ